MFAVQRALVVSLLAPFGGLIFAYGLENWLSLQVCTLCHYQRLVYFLIMSLSGMGLVYSYGGRKSKAIFLDPPQKGRLMIWGIWGLWILGCILAIYQVLIEHKIVALPAFCQTDIISQSANFTQFAEKVKTAIPVSCQKSVSLIGGFSFAEIAALYTLLSFFLSIHLAYKKRN